MSHRPFLSVIVVIGRLRERAAGCLASLLSQQGVELEVLVMDTASEDRPVLGSADPRVRTIPLPAGTLFSVARAQGVQEARGEVVAFLEEHARALPGWGRALAASYDDPRWAGVGALAVNGNPRQGRSDVIGLMSYGLWYPPHPGGEVRYLPGHNASYRTEVLRELGDELARWLSCDIVLQDVVRKRGHRVAMAREARFAHLNESDLRSIGRGIFLWYRLYGPLRAQVHGWSAARRLLYVLAVPLLPLYFLVGFHRRVGRLGSEWQRLLRRHAGFVYLVHLCAAAGQAVGLLLGPGDAARRFSDYELHEPRVDPESGVGAGGTESAGESPAGVAAASGR